MIFCFVGFFLYNVVLKKTCFGKSLTKGETRLFKILKLEQNLIELSQSDFDDGTYFAEQENTVYRLTEDIVFNPSDLAHDNDGGMSQVLGHFAAFAFGESDCVLDLNGHKMSQHMDHFLKQRFFSLIELTRTPFGHGQGPADFGPDPFPCRNSMVINGTLGLTSHYGIHGAKRADRCNLVVHNVVIEDHTIGGISINGPTQLVCRHVSVLDTFDQDPVSSLMSHAIFTEKALKKALSDDSNLKTETLQIHDQAEKTGQEILDALTASIVDYVTFYPNTTGGLPDGNATGIAVGPKGVLVGPVPDSYDSKKSAKNVIFDHVTVQGIKSKLVEVIGITMPDPTPNDKTDNFGIPVQKYPFGAVFRAERDQDEKYVSSPLQDTGIFLAKHTTVANITLQIVEWAEQGTSLVDVMSTHSMYFRGNMDSMAHDPKGTIGIYLSNVVHGKFSHVTVDGVRNESEESQSEGFDQQGGSATGLLIGSSRFLRFDKYLDISNVVSVNGESRDIKKMGQNFGLSGV